MTLPPAFPVTFIWNGDLPSQGIVRQVGDPNGSISLPSAQPTCPTDMRGWWVGVQMIVTSLMNYLQALPCGILPALLPRFSRDIATSFSRDIHLERGHALSGHCEAGGRSQWKHFPSICTANMPHRYAWLVGGCADDCHEPDELFASTSLRHSTSIAPKTFPVTFPRESARIASGISLQYPSDNIRNLPRGIQWHCPTIST